jgi:hypothetical protein
MLSRSQFLFTELYKEYTSIVTYTDAFSDDVGVKKGNKYVIKFKSYVATHTNVQKGIAIS